MTQVGDIKYTQADQPEENRHLKRLPNAILTEQSLKDMLGPELEYLNLSNQTWVTNEHLTRLGFLAENISVNLLRIIENISIWMSLGLWQMILQ